MEPAVKAYLIRIVRTLSLGLLWMILNSTFGIMYSYAFIENKIKLGNIIFYFFFLVSLAAYLRYIIKLWSKPLNFEDDVYNER
ncbi:MAG: hypothetical protein C0459_00090 [Chitinophaga sp.]|jgi:hypothetical protein|nr:hypothetical protein [Chitinophaga sp.]